MKRINFFIVLAFLFASDYALAIVPPCPCDNVVLSNGTTGNDIIELLCPGGMPGEGTQAIVDQGGGSITSGNEFYNLDGVPIENAFCQIGQAGGGGISAPFHLTVQQFESCRESLIQRCGLNINPIPTLSEWGMIAMAGVLGLIGLVVASRRRKAAA